MQTPATALYPPIAATRTGMLPVDDLHTLYWEESGNAQGLPVVFLHGEHPAPGPPWRNTTGIPCALPLSSQ